MIKIPNNKKLVNMLTVLTIAGEMPLAAASQAGSHEGYRKLFYELSKKQVFVNTKTKEQMSVKLIHMSERGDKRRCRLSYFGVYVIVIAVVFELAFIYKLNISVFAFAFWLFQKFYLIFQK